MLRRVSEPKREEVAGGWMHNEELHYLFYASPKIMRVIKIKEDETGRICSKHGRDQFRDLVYIGN